MSSDLSIQELERIYNAAAELAGDEQSRFLDSACAGRPQTRRQIELMLSADASFLSESILHGTLRSDPTTIGRWQVRSKLGEGGLGLVYRAETTEDGVTLEAAVKILRPGFDEGFFRGRFQQERQILANLNHPGIARFIDCGADSSGRSFLAMEFIDGLPLPSFLDASPLPTARKIAIFDSISQAVQYLHSRLIVHGDIKPGNIMVTPDGAAKLLDFGTARLLEGGPSSSELTRLLITPSYASPEQKRGEGPSVAADIYALGRLLQELLGSEKDPDLQAIARRCLAEEPDARYPSAGSLIEDIHRWRTGYPVHARRQTFLYALGRLARRHWHVAALTALLIVSLAAGWWNSRRNAQQTRLMAEEARRQASLALSNAMDSQRHRQRAESATAEATGNATRYRHLLGQMLQDDEFTSFGVVGGAASLERSYRVLIAQLEKESAPSTSAELSVAWRRLGAALCHDGDYTRGIQAISNSIQHAARVSGSLETVSRLVLMKIYRARGDRPAAVREAAAALNLYSHLPTADRQRLASHQALQLGRLFASQAYLGKDQELALLLEVARHPSRGLATISLRSEAITRIVEIYSTRGEKDQLAPFCNQAAELLIAAPHVRRACGRPVLPALRAPAAHFLLQMLVDDGRAHLWKLHAGEIFLNTGRQLYLTGNRTEARHALNLAELALKEVSAADPNGPGVTDFRKNVEAARAFAAR
ncbi:MAG: serine/threonine protein kinase [Bryobacterales bacterium]|nr:serine/threonine protein kinase [Bryobacterales bacterium]